MGAGRHGPVGGPRSPHSTDGRDAGEDFRFPVLHNRCAVRDDRTLMPSARRWRTRLRKLREDPIAFWAELPFAPISNAALALIIVYARLAPQWSRLSISQTHLRAIGPEAPNLYRIEGLKDRASKRPASLCFTLPLTGTACVYANNGAVAAAALIRPGSPAVLPSISSGGTVRLLRTGGETPASVIALAPISRPAVYRMQRRGGADRLSALRLAWPSTRVSRTQVKDTDYRRWLSLLPRPECVSSALLFSILMPVRDPAPHHLRAAVDSALSQTHGKLELIIVDDGSRNSEITRLLDRLERGDPRIQVLRFPEPVGVTAATNRALAVAAGDIVVFLDHDDLFAPELLGELARAFADPAVLAAYTDEDRLDENGNRSEPVLKGVLDVERLLSHNYVNHALAIRTGLLRDLGGLREAYEGAQDHDLLLRVIAEVGSAGIRHVPGILYHWRSYPGLNSLSQTRSDEMADARRRAVDDHLNGVGAKVLSGRRNRVIWPLSDPPSVRVIVPTRDNADHLLACIRSVLDLTVYPRLEITIVDNGSIEPAALAALSELSQSPAVEVMRRDGPFNFSRLINAAATRPGEILALLNDDVVAAEAGWLREMVSLAVRPDVGAVGAKLLYPDGRLQHAGLVLGLGNLSVAGHELRGAPGLDSGPQQRLRVVRQVSAVTAACLVVSRDKFIHVGGFDEISGGRFQRRGLLSASATGRMAESLDPARTTDPLGVDLPRLR